MDIELSGHYGYRRIVRSVLPSIAMVLITSVYSIVDGFFVSNFAGKSGFAAVNLMYPAMMIVSSLGLMVGSGGAALTARLKGEGYAMKANRVFTMLVRFITCMGVVLSALLALGAPVVARWLGADEAMLPECVLYTRLSMIGMPAFLLQMAFQSFYMAAERPQLGTLMAVISGVTNIVLDALLVWLFEMGVAGAAIATAASQIVGGLYPVFYFASARNRGTLRLVRTRTIWSYVGRACTNGLSEYVGTIAMNIVSICYNLQLMRHLGQDGVAAYGVIMYIAFVYAAIFIGYNIGMTPVVGYHYGAGDVGEQRSILRKSVALIGVVGLVLTGLAEFFAAPVSRLFVGYDVGLAALTEHALRIYMLCFLVCGWSMFMSALFTGMQNGVVSAVIAFSRTLGFEMVCVWVLPALFGIDGIWWAVNVAEVLALVLSAVMLIRHAPQLVCPMRRVKKS